jgi:integrase
MGGCHLEKRTLLVRAVERGAKKTGRARELPISARLAAVLDIALTAAKRQEVARPTDYVFGNAIGQKISNVKKAWESAVLRSNGHEAAWIKGALTAAARAHLNAVDLHFHDLRHEAGCRWLEDGVPLHHIQEMPGHRSLAQTSTYLQASELGLRDSMKRYDEVQKGKN